MNNSSHSHLKPPFLRHQVAVKTCELCHARHANYIDRNTENVWGSPASSSPWKAPPLQASNDNKTIEFWLSANRRGPPIRVGSILLIYFFGPSIRSSRWWVFSVALFIEDIEPYSKERWLLPCRKYISKQNIF